MLCWFAARQSCDIEFPLAIHATKYISSRSPVSILDDLVVPSVESLLAVPDTVAQAPPSTRDKVQHHNHDGDSNDNDDDDSDDDDSDDDDDNKTRNQQTNINPHVFDILDWVGTITCDAIQYVLCCMANNLLTYCYNQVVLTCEIDRYLLVYLLQQE
jgi:ABC-type Zn2+ transport system substrate-binding protein/surface adhesin